MAVILPDLLTEAELAEIRALLAQSVFADGKQTAGARAQRVKKNEQIAKDSPGRERLHTIVKAALDRHLLFQIAAQPRRIRPPLLSRYRPGMAYGPHVDDALMGAKETRTRSDLSLTIFLNDPGAYDGGELTLYGGDEIRRVKLPAGSGFLYPSTQLHEVSEVTRGERIVAVTWIESYIRRQEERDMLADLAAIRAKLADLVPDAPETDLAYRLYANLLRLWAET